MKKKTDVTFICGFKDCIFKDGLLMIKGTTFLIHNINDNEFAAEGSVSTKIDSPVSKSTACVLKVN